jgi:GntR family transcriptional regulator
MKLFPLQFKPGVPVYEQVLYAARKAIIAGELQAGEVFPSVRTLSAEYRINPNTVQKALTALRNEGLIESIPGIGNRVTVPPEATRRETVALLEDQLEAVVLRAKQLNLTLAEVTAAIDQHWKNL